MDEALEKIKQTILNKLIKNCRFVTDHSVIDSEMLSK